MIDSIERDEAEDSRCCVLFRALSILGESDGGTNIGQDHDRPRQNLAKTSANSLPFDNNKPNEHQEHYRQSRSYTRVTRIYQRDTWDCGIACLLMIASWLKESHNEKYLGGRNCSNDHCDQEYGLNPPANQKSSERSKIMSDVGTKSIWTSDLLLQLQSWKTKRLEARASELGPRTLSLTKSEKSATPDAFTTDTTISAKDEFVFVLASQQVMGADESYRNFEYYQNAFEEDQFRVARTFRNLHRQAVPMLQTTVFYDGHRSSKGMSLSTVIDIVERDDCLAIVLLDNNFLLQGITKAKAENIPSGPARSSPYAGHYVILCGTSDHPSHIAIANSYLATRHLNSSLEGNIGNQRQKERFCFVLCNPDPSSTPTGSNYMFVTPERFEVSWRAEGTDEDIIFLRKANGYNREDREEENDLRHSYAQRFSARIQALVRKLFGS